MHGGRRFVWPGVPGPSHEGGLSRAARAWQGRRIGVSLDLFYFFPAVAPTSPALLVRVVRPTAPNYDGPAVDLADALAEAKAGALAWALRGGERPPAPLGAFAPLLSGESPEDAALLTTHGGERELWWSEEAQRPSNFAIGPATDEEDFWARVSGASHDDATVGRLRRPATKITVRLVTEADARLVDTPPVLVEDVAWLTGKEWAQLHDGGLAAFKARPPATSPPVTEAELRAVKLGFVERAVADDLARGDRRMAAFRASDLGRYDPPAALALIERVAGSVRLWDDRNDIAWGLAYGLYSLRRAPGRADLLERWRGARDRVRRVALAELAKLERGR